MKIILSIFIIIIFNFSAYTENKIPGFLELDLSIGRDYNFYGVNGTDKHYIGYSEVNMKYGGEFNWFEPYGFASWKTFFKYDKSDFKKNYPFRDIYSWGLGFKMKIFYFEYEHRCSHPVFSRGVSGKVYNIDEENYLMFDGMPTLSYDRFKLGIKLRVD